ncbi:MAG: hypothetical protein NC307_07315 [Roseburia sp.]|nr:hypothetical protein [Roseburia sp.]
MAEGIKDEEVQTYLLAGLMVFADKAIDQEAAEEIWRRIYMTKFDRLIGLEIEKGIEKGLAQAVEQAERKAASETARQMFGDGIELSKVKRYVHLSDDERIRLQQEVHAIS